MYKFQIQIWIYMSQEFIEKEIFLSMLTQMTTKLKKDEYIKNSIAQLAQLISENLEGAKFLLVFNDV